MAERKTRYNELLGVPNHIKDPDLYQLLGVERDAFDPNGLEDLYRERMGTLQKIRSPKHKSFIEYLKGELRRARTTLTNAKKREEYDQELFEERREQLELILEVVLANNILTPAEEERIFAAGGDVGLNQAEVQRIVEEELGKRGAQRGGGLDQAAPPAAPSQPPLQSAPPAQTLPPSPPPQPAGDGGAPLGVLQALGLGGPAAAPPPPHAGAPLPPPGQPQPLGPPGGGFVPPPLAPSIHQQGGGGGFMPPPLAPSIHDPGGGMPGLAPSIHQQPPAGPVVVGVCTGCMAPVNEGEVQQGKAEQFPDGRLHCPQCVTRLVAGLMCAVCYGAVTRAEKRQNEVVVAMIKAQQQKRAIHTRCLPQGVRPKQPPAAQRGGWGAQQAQRRPAARRPAAQRRAAPQQRRPAPPAQGGGWGQKQASSASQSSGRLPAQPPAQQAPPSKPAAPGKQPPPKKSFKAPAPRKKRSWHKD